MALNSIPSRFYIPLLTLHLLCCFISIVYLEPFTLFYLLQVQTDKIGIPRKNYSFKSWQNVRT